MFRRFFTVAAKIPASGFSSSIIPPEFLTEIGYLSVCQTEMDQAIDLTIRRLAGLDDAKATAILAPIMNLSTRLGSGLIART